MLDLIRAVEVLASGMRKIVRHFGHPVPYVIGETAKNLSSVNVALGQLLAVPNKDAKIGQLEMTSELSAIITLYRELRQALHEITRIPEVATGKLENAGALSGVALSILYGPAIELGSELRLSYGPMLANLAARILELGGQRNRIVTPQWPNITPEDRQAGVERERGRAADEVRLAADDLRSASLPTGRRRSAGSPPRPRRRRRPSSTPSTRDKVEASSAAAVHRPRREAMSA